MRKFRVKVCGITRPQDGRLAAELGADMIGLIFYRKSPRFVSQVNAAKILKTLPPIVARVGLFVDESFEIVLKTAERHTLDYIQLHGNENAAYVKRIQKAGFRVIKSFTIGTRADYRAVTISPADICLLDNRTDERPGGTGETFDWSIKPLKKISNLMLAGGVTARNVVDGVKTFNPLIVDVNSGVESNPGIKSAAKLKAFFKECDRIRYGK